MARTILDIFKPEIDEKIDIAVSEAIRNNLFVYVQRGDMALDRAAQNAGMTPVDFAAQMSEAGYSLPT